MYPVLIRKAHFNVDPGYVCASCWHSIYANINEILFVPEHVVGSQLYMISIWRMGHLKTLIVECKFDRNQVQIK